MKIERVKSEFLSLYYDAKVPERHQKFRPSQSSSPEWSEVYVRCRERLLDGSLLALVGNRGCGKTQMAACLIGYATKCIGHTARYAKAQGVFLDIRNAMRKSESELQAISKFLLPSVLVIDSFEVRSESDFENRTLDYILDCRYDSCKSTVLISNDTKENFKRTLGPSVVDRMIETGGLAECSWGSLRSK